MISLRLIFFAAQMNFICRAEHIAQMDPLLRPALQKVYGCQPWLMDGLEQALVAGFLDPSFLGFGLFLKGACYSY